LTKEKSNKKIIELQLKIDKLKKRLDETKAEAKKYKFELTQELKMRKKLEKQIQKSEEKYSALFKLSPSGIVLGDTRGKILDANEAICKSLGYNKSELIGKNVKALNPKTKKSTVQKNLKRILDGELLYHQVENIRKDGSVCYNELYECKITLPTGEDRILTIANDITERKKVEDSFKESEKRYRTLFETANDAIFLMDGNKFIDCNPKTLEMFDCKWEDIINQPPFKFSPPKQNDGQSSKTKAVEKINAALYGQPQFFEWVHCRLDGSPFEAEVSLNSVKLLTKNYLIAIVRDITERKLNEKNLRESRENYKSLFNGVTAGIFRTTPEGVFINANDSLVKMLKFPDKETLMNKRVSDLYYDTRIREDWVKKLIGSKKNQDMETQLRCYDGTSIWAFASAKTVRDTKGKVLYFEGYLRDISAKKLAEIRLLESQQRYLALFNNSQDAIILENERGEILDVNNASSEMFGYEREEMIGMLTKNLSADSKSFYNIFSSKKELNNQPTEILAKLKNGGMLPIEISAAAFTLGNQKLFISTARDISDRKKTEEKIKLYTSELKELNAQKDRLFSILAHDLKSPLSALIGYTDLLESEYSLIDDKEKIEYINSIGQVSRNLNHLLETILEWSIIQKDKISLKPRSVYLKEEVDKIIQLFKISLHEKNIIVVNRIKEDQIVNIDLNILHTLVRNFISNAIKFSRKSGRVVVNSKIKNGDLELSVEDSGVGMNQQTLKKIFTNGSNTPSRGTKNELGSGLGLLICKELVEKIEGQIWAKSTKDQGSKFIVSVPISD
jgi:PAS domain S-box-containing protein